MAVILFIPYTYDGRARTFSLAERYEKAENYFSTFQASP